MSNLCGRDDDAVRLRAAISGVIPPQFRDRVEQHLRESEMRAGRLTRHVAKTLDRDIKPEKINRRVVGVQLIYEGLKLTRALARFPPWKDKLAHDADLKILVANVLVARGFSLLARTEATPEAVEVVRGFARDETNRDSERPDTDLADRALEADVFELGIVAGVTATGANRPTGTHEFATRLSESLDDEINDRDAGFSESIVEELEEFVIK